MAKNVDVNTEIEINSSLSAVAKYAFNLDNAPNW